jgi:putative hydrolase
MDPAKALRLIGFYLERAGEPTFKVQAFRKAAAIVDELPGEEVQLRARRGTLTQLGGIGKTTAAVISDAVAGKEPEYLSRLIQDATLPVAGGASMRVTVTRIRNGPTGAARSGRWPRPHGTSATSGWR